MTVPEFSRIIRIDTLGAQARRHEIEADAGERAALARRFGLVSIGRLSADAALTRNDDEVRATGRIRAQVVQSCVATGEPVPQDIDESFDIIFRPGPVPGDAAEEIELGQSDLDIVFYEDAGVDLGEAAAETLLLALDPYPRVPGAEERLKEAGVRTEEESGPFGALAALRDKMNERP